MNLYEFTELKWKWKWKNENQDNLKKIVLKNLGKEKYYLCTLKMTK